MPDTSSLPEFLSRHVTAYDLANDDYERPPFAADIKEGRNDPIYNAHSYHTKVAPRIIIPYILHYTQPGDLVLDPFCGSGMTGVAAQMCADPPMDLLEQFPELKDRVGPRFCVLNDLSPAACHIAYNYNTPVDVEMLRCEFEQIKAAVKDEFERLYGTEHYEPAIGPYAVEALASHGELFADTDAASRKWTLLSRPEVEERLGYPVTELPRDPSWGDAEPGNIQQWICIPATIQHTIWSDVYMCEGFVTVEEPTGKLSTRGKNVGEPIARKKRVARGCGKRIILWNAARDRTTGEVAEVFACPHCQLQWRKIQIRRAGQVPVLSSIEYVGLGLKNGRIHTRKTSSFRPVTVFENDLIDKIGKTTIGRWVPLVRFDRSGPQYRRNALSAREIDFVTDLFLKRSLHALALLWSAIDRIDNARLKSALCFGFTAILQRASRLNRLRPSGAGDPQSGTIYISSLTREENVWSIFENRVVTQLKAFTKLGKSECIVTNGSACSVPDLPNCSIDYIFADPPFGSNIYYSEPNLIWEAWLGKITDATEEAVVHRKNDGGTKRIPDYARLMQAAFNEMFRALKPGRWATIEFNNSDGAVFEAIKEGIRQAGFEIVNMLLLDKEQKTFKQIKGAEGVEDVVDKDVVFNLHKPTAVAFAIPNEHHDLEQQITDVIREHLRSLPERIKSEPAKYNDEHRTTATINSILMNALIPRGVSVEKLNLPFIERICSRYFRKLGQRWYLRGEAVGSASSGELIEEEVEIKDELNAIDWLRQRLQTGRSS